MSEMELLPAEESLRARRDTPTSSRPRTVLAGGVVILQCLMAGCDTGGDAGPSGVDSPIISNFLVGRDDTLPCPSDEKPRAASIDYEDPQGDVRGGTVEIEFKRGSFTVEEISSPVPAGPVVVTGTTRGQVRLRFCVEIVSGGEVDAIIVLTDRAGNRSNELKVSVETLRPST